MGMGNYPCFANVVEESFVKELCPNELDALRVALDEADYDIGGLAYNAQLGGDLEGELGVELNDDAKVSAIIEAYDALRMAFTKATEVDGNGLTLDLMYHNKEDRGDEVDGHFWVVDDTHQLSPAGEKFKDKWERKGWTVYG